ncbi:putative UDP-glucuronate:xylan alpha-glucuronosyltransferase 3 isoform X2 [Rhodamnia argentea]|uniref:Hexosyltransferase n=1 Tax=Rhodamnia argentea TaxID=178133 RepID=A0A8B8QAE8_9MYRT|nr:putative UDP-glucuronate:xylan alpha-glucuronosyltransferase 3 isoform X2 [Rhodamnia argentea]
MKRLSPPSAEQSGRRMFPRSKYSNDMEKALDSPIQDRDSNYKNPTMKVLLIIILFGSFLTIYRSHNFHLMDDDSSSSPSRLPTTGKLSRESTAANHEYTSSLDIEWDQISNVIEESIDKDEYEVIGLLNFDRNETNRWKQLFPESEHVVLRLDSVRGDITWESLYPEWIDEEQHSQVPNCPTLPQVHVPGKPRVHLIAVKLPCDKSRRWSRDVARLHLQLEAARLAASAKSYSPVRVLLVTDCLPIPNLFACKDLLASEGYARLYEPDLDKLQEKFLLPIGSCELAFPLEPKAQFHSERSRREAYATILHSAHVYVCGAIAAAQSIRMSGSTRDLVILVDEMISEHHRAGLEAAGWKVHTIQRIRNPRAQPGAYNEWNYSKFRLWQLTDYDKIIFIDADQLVLRNIDFLFRMPELSATGNNGSLFNSGVMVIEPSNCTFKLLMDHINEIESYNGGDQGYLNEIFTWWHRIPKHMNFLKHFWEGDDEETKLMKTSLFGADPPVLYVLHYLGLKPWLCFRDYDCNWNVDYYREFASDAAHRTWWKLHDTMPEHLQKFCLLSSKQKAALEWDRRRAKGGNYMDGHWKIEITDERLQACSEDFCSWESMLLHWGGKNRTDNAATDSSITQTTGNQSFSSL